VETEWCGWDAPWEDDDGNAFVENQRRLIGKTHAIYRKLEIDDAQGRHIGWVSTYYVDGDKTKTAVGIDLPGVSDRGKGFGENALSVFMAYLFDTESVLYTQTWSGNTAMLRLAEKIGFTEIERIKNLREVRGERYDALTFSISKDRFFQKYPNLSKKV
jgi:RimJ/RimL family protein N-acetyltransferase